MSLAKVSGPSLEAVSPRAGVVNPNNKAASFNRMGVSGKTGSTFETTDARPMRMIARATDGKRGSSMANRHLPLLPILALLALGLAAHARDETKAAKNQGSNEVPRGQDVPPGPALSPQQAIARYKLPDGFKMEVVAAEPELINPTSFTFDDQGRIWVTESVEYPRASAGKGQDRVKILESTKHDGHYDKVSLFKDGLNIPCGVAIGNGGVYVTNSPDVLFLQHTDGDGKADKEEVILTGFGRDDRHELPNSLTWGPDGWLYGMNGVFNRSRVKDPASGKMIDFTCAIWRYHPRTKKFELFAEGTSNPWGLDYNRQGDWFVS